MKQIKHLLVLSKKSFTLSLAQSFILQLSILAILEKFYLHLLVLGFFVSFSSINLGPDYAQGHNTNYSSIQRIFVWRKT